MKFPVFSLLAGNLGSETGSLDHIPFFFEAAILSRMRSPVCRLMVIRGHRNRKGCRTRKTTHE